MNSRWFWALNKLFALSIFIAAHQSIAQELPAGNSRCELCFYGPDNIVFDAAGNAYITDTDHKTRFRVLKVSPSGKRIAEWHVFDKGQGQRKGPEGIAITRNGEILVTDGGTSSVLRLSAEGRVLGKIGVDSPAFEDLGHIAIDSSGNIYVSEAGPNSIRKFSADGKQIDIWKHAKGSGREQWNSPQTIAMRGDGTLVVEDWGNHRIVVLSPEGSDQFLFGEAGTKPGQFSTSAGLGVDGAGNIYVADDKLHRLQKFDESGRLLVIFGGDGGSALFTDGPGGVAIDQRGNIYCPDGLAIVKLSPGGKLLERWR